MAPAAASHMLRFVKVVESASTPLKGSARSAGFDLKSAFNYEIPGRSQAIVDTGIKVELPEGCYGRVAPRSGLAAKNSIDVMAGVIDEDYRGIIKVILFNHSDVPFKVSAGDRIAQLICEKIIYPDIEEVKELSDTVRGETGFGASGMK